MVTLAQLIAEAAFLEGFDVKTSELHGLSQRGGSVETHVRYGKKINSPLVEKADLIISLEILESLRKTNYLDKETKFLINNYSLPYSSSPSEEETLKMLDKLKNKKYIVEASKICQQKLGQEVISGVYLLGFAVNKGLIRLKPESVLEAIKNLLPEKYRKINEQAFELAQKE